MAVANLLQLIFYIFVQESNEIFTYDLTIESNFSCKISMFLRRVIRQISPLVETIMTLDRFLSVYFPKKSFFHKRVFMSILIIGFLTSFAFIDIGNLFFYLEIKFNKTTNQTVSSCKSEKFISEFSDLTATILRTILPFLVMLVFNILIAKKMINSRSKIASSSKSLRKQYQFTITVTGMNVVFLFLNLPLSIFFIMKYCKISSFSLQEEFIYAVVYAISTLHYSSLFFIGLICNSIFLNEILTTLRIKKAKFSQVSPSGTNGTLPTSTVHK